MSAQLTIKSGVYIDGQWSASVTGAVLEVRSPTTEEVIARVRSGSSTEVDSAVVAARRAFDKGGWSKRPIEERVAYVRAIADGIERRAAEFARVLADESGQPVVKNGLMQNGQVLNAYRHYCSLAETYSFESEHQGVDHRFLLRKEPLGVVAIVAPWNAPMLITSYSLPAALLAGCTVVLKPAPETPLHAMLLAEVIEEAGLPAGVFNLVSADRDASEALVRHPGVDKVSFTGSTDTGRRVATICAESFKRFSLELGGKSAAIILDDADLNQIIPGVALTGLMNNGEACVGQTRILAPRTRYAEVLDALVSTVEAYHVGDPFQPETDTGPLITERQRQRVERYIAVGRAEGARAVLGGGRPAHLNRGWFVEPTIFSEVDNEMRIAQEEIFGPVLCVIPYDEPDDAIRIANDSRYGLSGSVWTADIDRGISVARQVRTGNYGVNTLSLDAAAPFGGYKQSGMGRQLGTQGFEGFLETKSIILP